MSDHSLAAIAQFRQLSNTIATAGQPSEPQLAAVRAAGYQVVVNLALPSSTHALANEAAIVAAQGMEYVAIPVVWENPTLADFEQFAAVLQAHAAKPVFVHCALNMRVSAFMYLYRRIFLGVDEATAHQDLTQIWQPNDRWQAFIEQVLQHYQNHPDHS